MPSLSGAQIICPCGILPTNLPFVRRTSKVNENFPAGRICVAVTRDLFRQGQAVCWKAEGVRPWFASSTSLQFKEAAGKFRTWHQVIVAPRFTCYGPGGIHVTGGVVVRRDRGEQTKWVVQIAPVQ